MGNYKFFCHFLLYAFSACVIIAATMLPIAVTGHLESTTMLGFTLSLSLSIALGTFIVMHGSLILLGCTTLEFHMFGFNSPYSFGVRQNVKDIFGPTLLHCLLPIQSPSVAYDLGLHHSLSQSLTNFAARRGRSRGGINFRRREASVSVAERSIPSSKIPPTATEVLQFWLQNLGQGRSDTQTGPQVC